VPRVWREQERLRAHGVRLLALALLLLAGNAQAEEDEAPVFPGHRDLTVHTKEVALEGSYVRLGDGSSTLASGAAVAVFYKPWISILGAAHFAPGFFDTRQTYDTRALVRLVYPEPVIGHLFLYGGVGGTVLFFEEPNNSSSYQRGFGVIGAIGAFYQLFDRFRVRVEARDHWLLYNGDLMRHNVFVTLSLVTLYR
jgi:hypothetical protein